MGDGGGMGMVVGLVGDGGGGRGDEDGGGGGGDEDGGGGGGGMVGRANEKDKEENGHGKAFNYKRFQNATIHQQKFISSTLSTSHQQKLKDKP